MDKDNKKSHKAMKHLTTLLMGVAIGFFAGAVIGKKQEQSGKSKKDFAKDSLKKGAQKARDQWQKKDNVLAEILEYFEDHTGVSVDDMKRYLDMSHRKVTHYLEALEEKGKIHKLEDDDGNVYYVKD